jgi:ribosomal protein L24
MTKGKLERSLRVKENELSFKARKKHAKRRAKTGPGEIHEIEMPIHISNVSLRNAEGKPVKAKVRITGKNKEIFYLEGDKEITLRQVRKHS